MGWGIHTFAWNCADSPGVELEANYILQSPFLLLPTPSHPYSSQLASRSYSQLWTPNWWVRFQRQETESAWGNQKKNSRDKRAEIEEGRNLTRKMEDWKVGAISLGVAPSNKTKKKPSKVRGVYSSTGNCITAPPSGECVQTKEFHRDRYSSHDSIMSLLLSNNALQKSISLP